ncbi:MAG TPA: DUF3108 domain-containing protein [Thermoanaerobaculia bacterium]|nr:DUF3108 domain-containing protein [Thermoanaerobaculia bacterium]
MNLVLAAILAAQFLVTSPVVPTFNEGETLDYTVAWLRITGGSARMTIAPRGDAYRVTSVAKSSSGFSRIFRVHDQIETIVGKSDFSTLKYTKRLDEDGDTSLEVTTVEEGVATRVRKKVKKVNVPRPVYDPISVIYLLRTFELVPGKTFELTLVADGKLYNVHARVIRRETVTTPAGKFNTVVVEPRMESGGIEREEKLNVWYTDDPRHIPVRIRTDVKFGSVTANLRAVSKGVTSIDPPVLRK